MRTRMTLQGSDRFSGSMRRMSEDLGREVESLLRQEARALCVGMGAVTEPGGFEERKAEAFRKTVEKQVRQVFASRENIYAVSEFIKRRSVPLGLAFYRAAKAGKTAQAKRYLRDAGVTVEQLDRALHRNARTGPKGDVPKGVVFQAVVGKASLDKYVREKRGLVGLAKAAAGIDRTSHEVRHVRLATCRACPELSGSQCRLCGCFVRPKTAIAGEKCPAGKW
jgi:hypothetical protein